MVKERELCPWEGVSVLWRGCSVIEAGRGVGRACVVKEGRSVGESWCVVEACVVKEGRSVGES